MITFRFQSISENIHKVKDIVEQIEREYNVQFPEETRHRILIALSEAVNNAIEHGNKQDENAYIEIRAFRRNNDLLIDVEDQGEGFTPSRIPDPRTAENIYRERGRGLFLMKELSDEIRFFSTPSGFTTELLFRSVFSGEHSEFS